MESISHIVETINNCLWGLPMILLLSGTHLFMTWKTGFIQKKLPLAIRLSLAKDPDSDGDISPFAALSTSLASTLGTGNIIGVGTAIALGGPGAVFWCWLTGIFGMATSYAESLIAIKYRVRTSDGTMQGGAMYALERALHLKVPAVLFACFGVLTSFGIGCGVQVNAIAAILTPAVRQAADRADGPFCWLPSLLERIPSLPSLAVGLVTGLITCAVIFGGVRSVSRVCEKLVPFMALFYMLGCLIILCMNRAFLGEALALIVKSAFWETGALAGGMAGSGIMIAARFGISRGLFSNEAGMGSTPHAHARARAKNPHQQGLAAMISVFIDTFVILNLTVFSILTTGAISSGKEGTALTQAAFDTSFVGLGDIFVAVCLLFFAFSTILGWHFFGQVNVKYLFGDKACRLYSLLVVVFVVIGSTLKVNLVWNLSDFFNGLMVIPNALALWALSGRVVEINRKYNHDKI